MYTYRVGEFYGGQERRWQEGGFYQYRGGGHELALFLGALTPSAVAAVREGAAAFAFAHEGQVIDFCYRFPGALDWSDSPYTIHLVAPEEERRPLPPLDLPAGKGAGLFICLCDAETGRVRAMRLVGLPHDFTVKLHAAIVAQDAAFPFDRAAYDAAVDAQRERYPDVGELVRERAVASCRFPARYK